ncbi:helix-turn-helix domain-containing protein [Chitinophaga sp. SYP-B3965]|uniref:AraC family transcriptional regulator n=1 Tax=Chitinophaga sp. SYP-B3965 TaxID=2663120 RepID=UPI001299C2F2|nr:AraC family transcriptional regulator [Chitinophaga sp. SYP-B3965]MRG44135.1 helix-turn-helix domain-containing protein [Chitinophaga sp. SYP-B3965]
MKVLQFTIPVARDKAIISQSDLLPEFYPWLHRHEEIQLTRVIRGSGTLVVENNMYPFQEGDIFWIGSNQPHVFKGDGRTSPVQALTLFFNPQGMLGAVFELQELKKIKAFLQKTDTGFKVPEEQREDIFLRMLQIDQTTCAKQLIHFMDLLHTFQMMNDLPSLISGTRLLAVNEQEGIRISYIYDYIMQHYDADITLEDIAQHANMSAQAFCRYFKKHTRLTFISFLNEVRVSEACKKLADGNFDSISTVAYQCGFNSIANFNRVFKSIAGKSPRDYIRELGQVEEKQDTILY